MKRTIMFLGCCILTLAGYSQTMAQMVERALEQIAALEGYIATAEKGYKIAEDGWHTIKDIKNGEFNLHAAFFDSLKKVNPQVAQMSEVAEILSLQESIEGQAAKQLASFKDIKWMKSEEISYIAEVYSVILKATESDVKDLTNVITDGQLQMTDGERIKRIQSIDNDMRGQSGLMKGFSNHANLLVLQRDHESGMDESIKNLYGIP